MKQATILLYDSLRKHGFSWGKDFSFVAHIHDEIQIQAREPIAEMVGKFAVESIKEAGKTFNFRCPLDGEFRIGNNWAETH